MKHNGRPQTPTLWKRGRELMHRDQGFVWDMELPSLSIPSLSLAPFRFHWTFPPEYCLALSCTFLQVVKAPSCFLPAHGLSPPRGPAPARVLRPSCRITARPRPERFPRLLADCGCLTQLSPRNMPATAANTSYPAVKKAKPGIDRLHLPSTMAAQRSYFVVADTIAQP